MASVYLDWWEASNAPTLSSVEFILLVAFFGHGIVVSLFLFNALTGSVCGHSIGEYLFLLYRLWLTSVDVVATASVGNPLSTTLVYCLLKLFSLGTLDGGNGPDFYITACFNMIPSSVLSPPFSILHTTLIRNLSTFLTLIFKTKIHLYSGT